SSPRLCKTPGNNIIHLNLPNKPQTESIWATVVLKGQKKARILTDHNAESVSNTNTKQKAQQHDFQSLKNNTVSTQPYRGKSSSQEHLDQRFFLRLSQGHEWRKLSPAGIRALLV
ncbi:putative eka-like protein, partial [Golovinomyces cichoracearum]